MDQTPLSGGHNLSFRSSLEVVAHDLWIKIGIPPWMFIFLPRFRKLGNAFNELEVYSIILYKHTSVYLFS